MMYTCSHNFLLFHYGIVLETLPTNMLAFLTYSSAVGKHTLPECQGHSEWQVLCLPAMQCSRFNQLVKSWLCGPGHKVRMWWSRLLLQPQFRWEHNQFESRNSQKYQHHYIHTLNSNATKFFVTALLYLQLSHIPCLVSVFLIIFWTLHSNCLAVSLLSSLGKKFRPSIRKCQVSLPCIKMLSAKMRILRPSVSC